MNGLLHATRRHFFSECGLGVGKMALAGLLARECAATEGLRAVTGPLAPKPPHFPAKAKAVIQLFMAGAPSQLELFDHKPKLAEIEGKPIPPEVIGGQRYAFIRPDAAVLGPQFKFARHGQSGAEISEMLPWLAGVVDEIAIVRSCRTDQFNHAPAQIFMNCGFAQPGRPSMGSWVTYGLGVESEDLPGFVVLTSLGKGGQNQPIAARQWSSGFLPSKHQGVQLRSKGDPVMYLTNPPGVSRDAQGGDVDAIAALNLHRDKVVADPEVATRIAQYEMAFKMQASVPKLMDVSAEDPKTLALYGCVPGDGSFAANCLLARRLAERGVRFIQLYHKDWDHHGGVKDGIALKAAEIDRACMALITDLKQRGMLDDTLIVWAGEFGRTPMSQGGSGRDHHNKAMTVWMAGGGIKGGIVHGQTDELGYAAVDKVTTVHDLHATMLHQLGIQHDAFTIKFQGLDAKLTGVEPSKPIKEIIS